MSPTHTHTPTTPERWLPIPGWTTYEVSSHGRLRSMYGPLRTQRDHNGRPKVVLSEQGRRSTFRVSTLVALAFLGPCPQQHQVHHKDHCVTHNWDTNLEYIRQGDHQREHHKGERSVRAKLTEADVREIRKLGQHLSARTIAAQLNLPYSAVRHVLNNETWTHLDYKEIHYAK